MNLTKPLIVFDIESTGVDVAKDRIVTLAATRINNSDEFCFPPEPRKWLFNPGVKMTDEVVAVHGITNEMVSGQPSFKSAAHQIHELFRGCDLAGFNLLNFDIPILWEELYRCDIEWHVDGRIIDVGNIFKKKEERTLSAAVQFYCGRSHGSAHDAGGDVQATIDVLDAQLARYPDLGVMDVQALSEFSRFDDRCDLAGKIVKDKEGFPCYSFGKSKGRRVKDDPSFAYWMLKTDFPAQTKNVLQKYLRHLDETE